LLNVGGDYAEQSHAVDLFEFTGLFACFFELEWVKRFIKLVDFGLDLRSREHSHVVVKSNPVELHSNYYYISLAKLQDMGMG
jgi:hypothetical protein